MKRYFLYSDLPEKDRRNFVFQSTIDDNSSGHQQIEASLAVEDLAFSELLGLKESLGEGAERYSLAKSIEQEFLKKIPKKNRKKGVSYAINFGGKSFEVVMKSKKKIDYIQKGTKKIKLQPNGKIAIFVDEKKVAKVDRTPKGLVLSQMKREVRKKIEVVLDEKFSGTKTKIESVESRKKTGFDVSRELIEDLKSKKIDWDSLPPLQKTNLSRTHRGLGDRAPDGTVYACPPDASLNESFVYQTTPQRPAQTLGSAEEKQVFLEETFSSPAFTVSLQKATKKALRIQASMSETLPSGVKLSSIERQDPIKITAALVAHDPLLISGSFEEREALKISLQKLLGATHKNPRKS